MTAGIFALLRILDLVDMKARIVDDCRNQLAGPRWSAYHRPLQLGRKLTTHAAFAKAYARCSGFNAVRHPLLIDQLVAPCSPCSCW